jgi:hypothetical protein
MHNAMVATNKIANIVKIFSPTLSDPQLGQLRE